eukprot:6016531-Pleurochrysis_carterae.AAC.1
MFVTFVTPYLSFLLPELRARQKPKTSGTPAGRCGSRRRAAPSRHRSYVWPFIGARVSISLGRE